MYNIDIDTGGTMTDGLVSGEDTVLALKVETTPHDVTIAFVDILEAARDALGFGDLRALLTQVEVIRWSSTITSNVLAQRTGPKLGLLVSAGHEADLYDSGAAATVVGTLVSAEDIGGIPADADEQVVRQAIKSLLDKGIRRINISLAGAFPDGSAEERIIEMIAQDYPDHFLGSIPALAGSEVVLRPDDSTRTIASLINAYVHPALATTLYRAEEIVRDEHGWHGNVLIGHINGGVARIGKTKAFDTIESGPLFGTHACAAAAAERGDARVIAIDVGGTTAKASAVQDGRVVLRDTGDLFGIPLKLDLPLLHSMALGGGSVARVTDGAVTLGPDSMGAAPGPACYGLGGRNATITDAFLVCGLISPTAFLDGRRTLDVGLARGVLEKHVGAPLGLDGDAAAQAVAEAAWDAVAGLAREVAERVGWDPAGVTLYAYGGNGPLFVTAVADRLGAREARFFRFGSVYSAYGSAISDVVHVYESALAGNGHLNRAGAELARQARRDLRGEGLDAGAASLEWEVRSASSSCWRATLMPPTSSPPPWTGRPLWSGSPPATRCPGSLSRPPPARTGNRPGPARRRTAPAGPCPCMTCGALIGQELAGPLLADGGTYTWLVTDGWVLSTDARGDASLTRKTQAKKKRKQAQS